MKMISRISIAFASSALMFGIATAQPAAPQMGPLPQQLADFFNNPPQNINTNDLLEAMPPLAGGGADTGTKWNPEFGTFDHMLDGKRITDPHIMVPDGMLAVGDRGLAEWAGKELTTNDLDTLRKDRDLALAFTKPFLKSGAKLSHRVWSPGPDIDRMASDVRRVFGQGYTARALNYVPKVDGKDVPLFILRRNGEAKAVIFRGVDIGSGTDGRVWRDRCARSTGDLCRIPLSDLGFINVLNLPDPFVTIAKDCDEKTASAIGNCALSSIAMGRVYSGRVTDIAGSAVNFDSSGQFAITVRHVAKSNIMANHKFSRGISNKLRSSEILSMEIKKKSFRSFPDDSVSLDLSIFQFSGVFDYDPSKTGVSVFSHPILHADQSASIKRGLPLVGVGFGLNSEVGGREGTDGTRRSGLINVISCEKAPKGWRDQCASGYYFVAHADPANLSVAGSPLASDALNPNRACKQDSGSPAYVQMEDGKLAVVGLLSATFGTENCDSLELHVNLTHPDVQRWLIDTMMELEDGLPELEARQRILTPAVAKPLREPFGLIAGMVHSSGS